MGARAQAILPLALVVGVLSFLWTEFALNFTFHWVTDGDLGIGLALPSNFHLILPTAFISWGMFFMAGGDNAAFGKVLVACIFGTVAALVTMLPDFWGIALWVGIFAFVLVAILIAGDWYYVAGTFPAFAATFLWWIATGLDGWAANGGGVGNSIAALGDPATAGTGAFGGVISTPWTFVWLNTLVTLVCGCILGIVSAKVAAAITPKPRAAEA